MKRLAIVLVLALLGARAVARFGSSSRCASRIETSGTLRQTGTRRPSPGSVDVVARNPTSSPRAAVFTLDENCDYERLFVTVTDDRGNPLFDGRRACEPLRFEVAAGGAVTLHLDAFGTMPYRVSVEVD
jgi:hypothetical protein